MKRKLNLFSAFAIGSGSEVSKGLLRREEMGMAGWTGEDALLISGKILAFLQQFRMVIVLISCQVRSARCMA